MLGWAVDRDSRVEVCDRESDGYGVHATGETIQNDEFRVDVQYGLSDWCDKSTFVGWEFVWRHKTVEERPAWNEPDIVGDWAYDY